MDVECDTVDVVASLDVGGEAVDAVSTSEDVENRAIEVGSSPRAVLCDSMRVGLIFFRRVGLEIKTTDTR